MNVAFNKFILDKLLIHGYLRTTLSLAFIPFDIIRVICNYWGHLLNNCDRITIQVSDDYIFDDEMCESLWNHCNTKQAILEFNWKNNCPQRNIQLIENYEKRFNPREKWHIDYTNEHKIVFVPPKFEVANKTEAKLLNLRSKRPGTLVQLPGNHIEELCQTVRTLLLSQPMFLELEAPLTIVGNIHGQFYDLLRIFEYGGYPSDANYLFLGGYVDYGKQSIETICMLFSYKIKYNETFFMLRSNHECSSMNRIFGFYDECKRRYTPRLWKRFTDCFNCMPVAAIIADKIFCCHGGLSPQLKSFNQIKKFSRPTGVPDTGLLCDLLWADPEQIIGWGENDQPDTQEAVSYIFGPDVVESFCKRFNIDLICRGKQVVADGYEFFAGRRLVTLFSAPNYMGEFDNCGSFMSVDESLKCGFTMLKPSAE
eukprot:23725_1